MMCDNNRVESYKLTRERRCGLPTAFSRALRALEQADAADTRCVE